MSRAWWLILLLASPAVAQQPITLQEAEQIAVKNNPSVNIARLTALVEQQLVREVRSAELPTVSGNVTAVDSHPGSRIAAGGLNNPIIYPRAAGGVSVSQLLLDFGRTHNLIASAKLQAQASADQQRATAADITFAVDAAFFHALNAQELVEVARTTVAARQTTFDQISALTNAKLKSDLDRSFADVALEQAKLLQLDAQNEAQAAMASLNTLLGHEQAVDYRLVPPVDMPAPPVDEKTLLDAAFASRPDLQAVNDAFHAAEKNSQAEHDLYRPSISALAAVGGSPVRADQLTPWYGAAGVNLSFPIFNGFLFNARATAADLATQRAKESVRDLRDRIVRDVHVTLLQAQSGYQRVQVAGQYLKQSNLALDLAQTRYNLGLSSIVELSQAQLQQTQAAIAASNAKFDYQAALAALRFQTGR